MISLKPHLQGIIKDDAEKWSKDHTSFGADEVTTDQGSFGAFIAGVVLGVAGAIFTMTLAIKGKPLTQKQIQEKISKYAMPVHRYSQPKTISMRSF